MSCKCEGGVKCDKLCKDSGTKYDMRHGWMDGWSDGVCQDGIGDVDKNKFDMV